MPPENRQSEQLLFEEIPAEDILALDGETVKIENQLASLKGVKRTVLVAYYGPYGCGKSTVLDAVRRKTSDQYTWHFFHPWEYSNRHDMWDGFTIEVSARIRNNTRNKIAAKIDGVEITLPFKILVIFTMGTLVTVSILAYYMQPTVMENISLVRWIKYFAPLLFGGLALVGLSYIIRATTGLSMELKPLKRTFEIQDYFSKSIQRYTHNKGNKPLVIVIEDIDRTDDEGRVFIETLKTFFQKHIFDQSIILILPQSLPLLTDADTHSLSERTDFTLRAYDLEVYWDTNLASSHIDRYLDKLNFPEIEKQRLSRILSIILADYWDRVSFRLLKYALRNAYFFTKNNKGLELRVAFLLIISRYLAINSDEGVIRSSAAFLRGSPQENNQLSLYPLLVLLYDEEGEWEPQHYLKVRVIFEDMNEETTKHRVVKSNKDITVFLDMKYKYLVSSAEHTSI